MKTLVESAFERATKSPGPEHQWLRTHYTSALMPTLPQTQAIVDLCNGIQSYVTALDGDSDYILGAAVGAIIEGVRELLNGELGGLDAGQVDAWLYDAAYAVGWDPDQSAFVGVGS